MLSCLPATRNSWFHAAITASQPELMTRLWRLDHDLKIMIINATSKGKMTKKNEYALKNEEDNCLKNKFDQKY